MLYPNKGNKHKLQKIFLASTPFNLAFSEYFKKRGNNVLEKYIDSLVEQYIEECKITPEELIEQIETKYQEYLNSLSDTDVSN